MAKKYDTAVVPMVIQRFNQRPAFHPQWGYALEEGWEPVGTTHQVEALEESGEQILIVYGLLKREPAAQSVETRSPSPGVVSVDFRARATEKNPGNTGDIETP